MIKILHVITDSNFGGAGRVLLNYLSCYNKDEFKVMIALPQNSKLLEGADPKKYEVYPLDGLYDRSFDRSDVAMLKKLIKTLRPDIVHSHGALSARIAAKQCGTKVVYTRHSIFDLPRWQTSFVGKALLGSVNRFYSDMAIAVSPAAADLLISTGSDPKKIEVVYNGVHKLHRVDEEKQQALREQYGISKDDFVCSIVARLEEVKGHSDVIDAAVILKEKGVQNIKILIAGTGGIEAKLKKQAKYAGVGEIVKFVGFVTDIDALYSVTDLCLNASYGTEATSMALLEGFSMGIPALASDFGGNPYVVRTGESGLLFTKRDPKSLCEKLMAIYTDTALYKTLSKGAYALYEKEFTAEAMTNGIENVYRKLMRGRSAT